MQLVGELLGELVRAADAVVDAHVADRHKGTHVERAESRVFSCAAFGFDHSHTCYSALRMMRR